jgi:hypothetical protein
VYNFCTVEVDIISSEQILYFHIIQGGNYEKDFFGIVFCCGIDFVDDAVHICGGHK